MQKGKLTNDVESPIVRGRIYGRCGDEVTVIFESGNVLIVEDKNGRKFTVKKELVEIKN